jgi:Tfp pilus assembly protein PilF
LQGYPRKFSLLSAVLSENSAESSSRSVIGRADEAIAQFRRALDINPRNVDVLNNIGNALTRLNAAHPEITAAQVP